MTAGSSSLAAGGWLLLAAYAVLVLVVVVRAARRTRTFDDYALGSRTFSPVAVALSLAASMMSAATFIINPGLVALYGISGVISMCVALPAAALVSLVVLSKGFRRRGRETRAATMAQWIGARFRSPAFAVVFALASLLLVTFIVLILVGLTKVVSKTLTVDELTALIGITVFVFGSMMFGGANSLVYTNSIQAGLMIVVAGLLLGSGLEHFEHGMSGFVARLERIDPNLIGATNPDSFLFRDWFEIVFCQLVVGVAIVCQPHLITRSLLVKSERDLNRYLAVACIVVAFFFSVVFVGLYPRIEFPDLTVAGQALRPDGIVSAYVVDTFPTALALVVVLGLIAAGISTLEGLIQAVSLCDV